jgi:hypothetical protein
MQNRRCLLALSAVLIEFGVWLAWRIANEDGGSAFVIKASCLAVSFAGIVLIINQWARAADTPKTPSSGPTQLGVTQKLGVTQNVAQIDGLISFKSFAALENMRKSYLNLHTLVLNSPGVPYSSGTRLSATDY